MLSRSKPVLGSFLRPTIGSFQFILGSHIIPGMSGHTPMHKTYYPKRGRCLDIPTDKRRGIFDLPRERVVLVLVETRWRPFCIASEGSC
jgi:hypothetical protein